jgi:hypothetical protein
VVTGGVTVDSAGAAVESLRVAIDGAKFRDATIASHGLRATGGATVHGGFAASGGVTFSDVGLRVVTHGATVDNDGFYVTGGVTVADDGCYVEVAGATLHSDGLHITGGVTVEDGLIINGGLTVVAGGLRLSQGVTVKNSGLLVTGGLTVLDSKLFLENNYNVFSDRRLKTNMVAIEDSLHTVQKLHGVYYDWTSEALAEGLRRNEERRHAGLLAQEVASVIPELVEHVGEQRYLGVNYQEMIPLLIESVKELERMLNSTESLISKIKQRKEHLNPCKQNQRHDLENAIDRLQRAMNTIERNEDLALTNASKVIPK